MTLGRLLARLHQPETPKTVESPKPRGLLRMFSKTPKTGPSSSPRDPKPHALPPDEGTLSAIIAPYADFRPPPPTETPAVSPSANAMLFELDSDPATLNKSLTPDVPPERLLRFSPVPDDIDALSFDDDISHSTSRHQSFVVPSNLNTRCEDQYTEDGSIIDASIHVFKHYLLPQRLKYIAASPAIVETSPSSPTPQRGELLDLHDRLQSPSPIMVGEEAGNSPRAPPLAAEDQNSPHSGSENLHLDDELHFSHSTSSDVFRDELLSLVKKHNLMIAKQQEEIRHLKELLVQERKYNSLLSSPLLKPCKSFPSPLSTETSPAESHSTTMKKRSRFLPLDIVVFGDDSGPMANDSGLLPPFAPSTKEAPQPSPAFFSAIDDISPTLKTLRQTDSSKKHNLPPISVDQHPREHKTLWTPRPMAADYNKKNTRNFSVSSTVSSVMSTSHGKSKPATDAEKTGADLDPNNISSSTTYSNSAISTNPHSNLTTPDTIYFQMGLAPKSGHEAPFLAATLH